MLHRVADCCFLLLGGLFANTPAQFYCIYLVNLESDEWTCRAAATKEEAMSLIEGGFQYVTTIDETRLFKKRK